MENVTRRAVLAASGLVGAQFMALLPSQAAPKTLGPSTPVAPAGSKLLHDANFGSLGFSQYKNLHPEKLVIGRDLGTTTDPAGSGEIVAWFDSKHGVKHASNKYARSSVESPARVYSTAHGNTSSVYAHRFSFYVPHSSAFTSTAHWTCVGEVHGAPWRTASRSVIALVFNPKTGNHYLRMGDDVSLLKEKDTIVPLGKWVDIVVHFNYNYRSRGGWIQLFMNTTGKRNAGWKAVPVAGSKGRHRDNLISDNEGNGWYKNKQVPAPTPRIGVYGNQSIKLYFREHKLGRSVRDVLGSGWDGKVDGVTYK
ncbi:MAG: heparin lyase I family protein [Kocuria sp.]|nr:heparin lyase I family protein [Kocuria sp.]